MDILCSSFFFFNLEEKEIFSPFFLSFFVPTSSRIISLDQDFPRKLLSLSKQIIAPNIRPQGKWYVSIQGIVQLARILPSRINAYKHSRGTLRLMEHAFDVSRCIQCSRVSFFIDTHESGSTTAHVIDRPSRVFLT